ncbi:C39 family peptidase [bacterium]|nr:C39 family peptidase [bacterium]
MKISTYTDDNLGAGQTWFYKIQAYNGVTRDSDLSDAVGSSTLPSSVPIFMQTDARWSGNQMGSPFYTIGSYGCVTTSIAMLLKYYGYDTDPGQLSAWIVNQRGYTDGFLDFTVIRAWDDNKIVLVGPYSWQNVPADMTVIDLLLEQDVPVLVKLKLVTTPSNGYGYHWVLITKKVNGIYKINDPYFSNSFELNNNSHFVDTNDIAKAIYGAVTYRQGF